MNIDRILDELVFLKYVIDKFRVKSVITSRLHLCVYEFDDLVNVAIHASEVVNLFGECFSSIIFRGDGLVRVSRYFYSIREAILDDYKRVSNRLIDKMIKSRGFWLDSRNIEYLRRRFPKSFEFHDEITRVTSEVSERYGYPIRAMIDEEGNSYIIYEDRFPDRDRFSLVDDVIEVLAAFREIHKTLYSLDDEYYKGDVRVRMVGYANLLRFLNLAEEVFKVLRSREDLIFESICVDPNLALGDIVLSIEYIKLLNGRSSRALWLSKERGEESYELALLCNGWNKVAEFHNLNELPNIIKNLKL